MLSKLTISAAILTISIGLQAHTITENGLEYTLDFSSNTASVARQINTKLTSVTIPAIITVDNIDYTVRSINDWAFYDCRSMSDIYLPPTLERIGSFAFATCNSLNSVRITDLDSWCRITFSDGYSNPLICGHNLYVNDELIKELIIPDGLTSLNDSAFNGGNFTSVIFPETLSEIGQNAFYACEQLKDIKLPESVTNLGRSVFSDCTSLLSAELPSSLSEISPYCFSNCTSLSNIAIPSNIKKIGSEAFEGCVSLKRVDISDIACWCAINFESEKSNPLIYASELYINKIPASSIVIPAGILSVPDHAFHSCASITSVEISGTVESIGDEAFKGCGNLSSLSLEKASALSHIGTSAFEGCSALSTLTIPCSVSDIGNYAFYECSNLTTAVLPNQLTEIKDGLFGECKQLSNIEIPAETTSIGFGAFYECTSLTEIKIPDKVKTIGKSAFYGCSSVSSLNLGNSLISLSAFAFSGCDALSGIYITTTTPPEVKISTFGSYSSTLWVPQGSKELYESHEIWKQFATIQTISTSIDTIESENLYENAEYYNLQGINVNKHDLKPGIYIRRTTGKPEKIIIR